MKIRLRNQFFLSTFLIILSLLLFLKDEIAPEWVRYQKEAYKREIEYLRGATLKYDKQREEIIRTIQALERTRPHLEQTLLAGYRAWEKGGEGFRVDRCITCHPFTPRLVTIHPEDFPVEVYGCAVCHGGDSRALKKEVAHTGVKRNGVEMKKRLIAADSLKLFWEDLTLLTPEGVEKHDFRKFNITGFRADYLGSSVCVSCHEHPESISWAYKKVKDRIPIWKTHMEVWKTTKFKTFAKLKVTPDFINGNESYRRQCYPCHTTGFNEKNGSFREEGVTCEGCHGPGENYLTLMVDSTTSGEGAMLAWIPKDHNVCVTCHTPRNHEMRKLPAREIIPEVVKVKEEERIMSPAQKGEVLFTEKVCNSCHTIGGGKLVGPDLAEITKKRDKKWLIEFLTDPGTMLTRDSLAKALLEEYKIPMPNPGLSKEEISAIISYLAEH